MSKVISLFLLIVIAFSLSLADEYKDGMKAYESGAIEDALELFLAKLTDKPDHEKSLLMVKQLLPKVIAKRKAEAQKNELEGNWDKAQMQYDRLRRLDKVIQSLNIIENGSKVYFDKIEISSEQNETKNKAADKYYQLGVEAMQNAGRADEAVAYFKEARKLIPDYKDAKELSALALYQDGNTLCTNKKFKKSVEILWRIRDFYPKGFKDSEKIIQECIDSAKVKIAVLPFDDSSARAILNGIGSNLSMEIISNGMHFKPTFLEFISREHFNILLSEQGLGQSGVIDPITAPSIGKLVGIQLFIVGKINATSYYPNVAEVAGENTAKIYRNGQSYSVYAKWMKHTRKGKVALTVTYQLLDAKTGRIVGSNSISKEKESVAQWITYNGEEDAIPFSVKEHQTTGDVPVLSQDILADDIQKQIAAIIADNLIKQYN